MAVDRNAFFREVALRISSSLDITKALAAVADYMRDIIPMDVIGLYYAGEGAEAGNVYAVAEAGQPILVNSDNARLPLLRLDEDDMVAIRSRAKANMRDGVFVQNEGRPHPRITHHLPQMAGYSELSLDLDTPEEQIGVLMVIKHGVGVFTDEHAALLRAVREPIRIAMSNARRYHELLALKEMLADDNQAMQRDLTRLSGNQVIGAEFGLREVMDMAGRVAPLTSPVLLLGETGTGKEVIANAIHQASPRRDRPMVRVQCGAIPTALLDSELFGHEKGAFTGAIAAKRGRFERADGGTLFLDEIGELSLEAQVKLLRVLQEKEIERLGGTQTIKVDVRVIAATHRNLGDMVRQGQFREDLWFRLNVFPIYLPPLRQRREDIPLLAHFFIARKQRELSLSTPVNVPEEAMSELLAYDWPGNVRELQNVVERALIVCQGRPLTFALHGPAPPPPADDNGVAHLPLQGLTLDDAMKLHIEQTLKAARGRVEGPGGAAARLDIHPSTLRARMRKLGISFGRDA